MSATKTSPEPTSSTSERTFDVEPDVSISTRSSSSLQRRPYQKPGFLISQAFERQALSCAGCLNQSAAFPTLCAMRS